MFERMITGLDIGSYSVKAVEIAARIRSVELRRFEEARIPAHATLEERQGTVQLFLEQNGFLRESVICAVPPARVTQRHLRFPFSGAKRVAQALPFELEEDLPFPLEGMVMTHEQVLVKPDQADVLVIMAPREQVAAHLEELRHMQIEPRVLEIEGAVLANVCTYLQMADIGRLVADVGHSKTNVCLLVDGKPVLLRSLPIAGHHFTEALAADLALPYETAEERKHQNGIFEVGTTKPVCPSLKALLDRLARELLRTVQSVVGDPLDIIAPSEILLAGGSARLDGLALFLEEETGLPCSVLNAAESGERAAPLAEAGPPVFAQAMALALRGSTSDRVTSLDLRQSEFAYTPDLSGLSSQLRLAVALFVLCLVLWPLSLYSRVVARRGEAEELRTRLATACSDVFPSADCGADPYATMQRELQATRETAEHLGVSGGGLSTLEMMRQISTLLPPELDVSLSELKIERRQIQLRGHAKDRTSVGAMTRELQKFEWFENVPNPDTTQDPRRNRVMFTVTITLKQPV